MNNAKKVFAFKLAKKKEAGKEKAETTHWKAREGLSLAGCTDPTERGLYRYSDNGVWC